MHNSLFAFAAVFGAAGDDHAQSCGDFVEPFGAILSDHLHRQAATWANRGLRFNHLFDARQMRRQRTAVGPALLRPLRLEGLVFLFVFRLRLGGRDFQFFQHLIELLIAQPLGFAPEARPAQHRNDVVKFFVGGTELIALG